MAGSNIIQYNGEKFSLSVSILAPSKEIAFSDLTAENKTPLMIDNIESLEIVHDVINPLLTGTLKYIDNEYSLIKQYQMKPYVYLLIAFGKHSFNNTNDHITFDNQFTHLFLINNIKIITQSKANVIYQIDFISSIWWNFAQSLAYNTNGQLKSVTDILAGCFSQCGLTLKTNNISTSSKLIYIPSANDTLLTSYNYLMSKTYIPENRADGISFIIYDHMTNNYDLWKLSTKEPFSLTKQDPSMYVDHIYIAIQNTGISELTQAEPNKISMANYQARTTLIESFFDYHKWIYDYSTNSFRDISVKTQSIIDNYMLGWPNYESRYYDFNNSSHRALPISANIFKREESIWSNTINQYKNIVGALINNNIVVINTAGDLRRKPGITSILEIDDSDDSPLLSLQGSWINLRTRHIITASSYKNNIMLGRIHQ